MNSLNHISFEKNGNTWLGHIVGNEREIELVHNSLFNYSGTSTKNLDMVSSCHATFWTTEKAIRNYLVNRNMAILLNDSPDKFKKQAGGAMGEARKIAAEQFAQLKFHDDARNFAADIYEYEFHEVMEPTNSNLNPQDETHALAHVPAWEGGEDYYIDAAYEDRTDTDFMGGE